MTERHAILRQVLRPIRVGTPMHHRIAHAAHQLLAYGKPIVEAENSRYSTHRRLRSAFEQLSDYVWAPKPLPADPDSHRLLGHVPDQMSDIWQQRSRTTWLRIQFSQQLISGVTHHRQALASQES